MKAILVFIKELVSAIFSERVLDWQAAFDPKSKEYGVRKILPRSVVPTEVVWEQGVQLDQGKEGACVGYAWTHNLLSKPKAPGNQPTLEVASSMAIDFYRAAQEIDEWKDNTSGTSILALAKVLKQRGYIQEYRWCFSIDDIRDAVIKIGPVVAGIKWNKHLSNPFKNGQVNVYGTFNGNHAVLIDAYYPSFKLGMKTYEVFRIKNSWGTGYGINGSAYITAEDLQKLVDLKGEFCVAINKKKLFFKASGTL